MECRVVCAIFAAVSLSGATAFADGESLAETGGYVPTDSLGIESFSITLQ